MVRDRYIVSFSEANNDQARMHSLSVTLADVNAYVRPAGLSVNLLDPELLRDLRQFHPIRRISRCLEIGKCFPPSRVSIIQRGSSITLQR